MTRFSLALASVLVLPMLGVGCHDGGGGSSEPLVAGLTVSEVALFQGLKAPLMKDGAPGSSTVPIIAGRAGLLRVYVTPQAGWTSREVLAHVELSHGTQALPALELKQMVSGPSTDDQLLSTINFDVPAESITADTTWSVTLYEANPAMAGTGSTAGARYPAMGQVALGAQVSGRVKVTLLPVVYGADGSNRMPATDDTQIERFRSRMMRMYPTTEVDITIGSPFAWTQAVKADGQGWDNLLNAVVEQRYRDGVPDDVYYYGLFSPSANFDNYCLQGCVLGLSPLAADATDTIARASIGVGFPNIDADASGTFVHEVGHAHGRQHAPCMTDDADREFPYSDGEIGTWGYDDARKRLIDPAGQARDMMSYCDPIWISDYTYSALFQRIQSVNATPMALSLAARWRTIVVHADGTAQRGGVVTIKTPAGEERPLDRTVRGRADRVTGRFFPFDHLPGGILLVPEDADVGALHLDGQLVK